MAESQNNPTSETPKSEEQLKADLEAKAWALDAKHSVGGPGAEYVNPAQTPEQQSAILRKRLENLGDTNPIERPPIAQPTKEITTEVILKDMADSGVEHVDRVKRILNGEFDDSHPETMQDYANGEQSGSSSEKVG